MFANPIYRLVFIQDGDVRDGNHLSDVLHLTLGTSDRIHNRFRYFWVFPGFSSQWDGPQNPPKGWTQQGIMTRYLNYLYSF